jgi:antirestriction protein ArdC
MSSSIVHNSCTPVAVPFPPVITSPKPRGSVYEIVTNQILSELERGVVPWRKPWRAELPCNLISGKAYRGLNVFLLACQGYGSRYWLTYQQTAKLGGHVKRSEHSTLVTFWHIGDEETETREDGTVEKHRQFLLRYYNVFNLEQTEGIDIPRVSSRPTVNPIEQCEAIVSGMPNAPRMEQSNHAWYRPCTDSVGMPSRALFNSGEEYYSTLFHELTHSTGHASRVGREGIEKLNTFGSESYSREELIAEMGAAMLCGVAGISPATVTNSAAYLQSWISRLRGDSRLLVFAASAAQKAADYIQGVQSEGGAA